MKDSGHSLVEPTPMNRNRVGPGESLEQDFIGKSSGSFPAVFAFMDENG